METLSLPVSSEPKANTHTHIHTSVKLMVFLEHAHKELPGYGKVFPPRFIPARWRTEAGSGSRRHDKHREEVRGQKEKSLRQQVTTTHKSLSKVQLCPL